MSAVQGSVVSSNGSGELHHKPDRHTYFMNIALAVRARADCKGQKVEAVIVIEDRIISTGYNGTPTKMRNCADGGCHRCANRDSTYKSGCMPNRMQFCRRQDSASAYRVEPSTRQQDRALD